MNERLRAAVDRFLGLAVYVLTGLAALILAAMVSSHFMGRAVAEAKLQGAAETQGGASNTGLPTGADSASVGPAVGPAPAPGPGSESLGAAVPGAAAKGKVTSALVDIVEDYNYNPVGKRDPFMPYERPLAGSFQGPMWPLQRFDLEQLKLVGIIWDVRAPKAMILDPTGKGYVVKVNERIGRNNGYIARIREGEIIVVESATGLDGKLVYTTKLMKLQAEAVPQ